MLKCMYWCVYEYVVEKPLAIIMPYWIWQAFALVLGLVISSCETIFECKPKSQWPLPNWEQKLNK